MILFFQRRTEIFFSHSFIRHFDCNVIYGSGKREVLLAKTNI